MGSDSISSAFVLVSLLPTTEPKPAKNLLLIGTAYEFQPPGKSTLFYHTVDRAGHAEEVKQRVLEGDDLPPPTP